MKKLIKEKIGFERNLDPLDAMNVGKNKEIDFTKVSNIEFCDIDTDDYPDFSDVYIESADYDGREATQDELDKINNDSEFVHEKLMNYLF